MPFTRDAIGFTDFTPSATTNIIYCSSSLGNDSGTHNNNVNQPYRTIQTAYIQFKALGFSSENWLLFKKGDTWRNEYFESGFGDNFQCSGISASRRILISSYDPAVLDGNGKAKPNPQASALARPLFYMPNINHDMISGYGLDYSAIIGLDLYCSAHDPSSPDYVGWPNFIEGPNGIQIPNTPQDCLIEDNVIRWFVDGIIMPGNSQIHRTGNEVRRNQIWNQWNPVGSGKGQGMYAHYADGIIIEENVWDNNGWNAVQGGRYDLNHNFYVSTWSFEIVVRGNISSNDTSGAQSRGGGQIYNNLFFLNPYPTNISMPTSFHSIVRDNVTTEAIWSGGDSGGPWGLATAGNVNGDIGPVNVGKVTFNRNIMTHAVDTNTGWAISIDAPGFDGETVSNNIGYRWAQHGNVAPDFKLNDLASGTIYSGNVMNDAFIEANPALFPHPERTIATYARDILGIPNATSTDFLNRAKTLSRSTWNPMLMAESVNDYIRQGFGMSLLGSAFAGGGIFLSALSASGTVNVAYDQTITASGGTAPYTFVKTSGSLPNGLILDSTGRLHGTPTVANTFNFTVTATDSLSAVASAAYSLVVSPSAVLPFHRVTLTMTAA